MDKRLAAYFNERIALLGKDWPTEERLKSWSARELVERHRRYTEAAMAALPFNMQRWAAWGNAAYIVKETIIERLERC